MKRTNSNDLYRMLVMFLAAMILTIGIASAQQPTGEVCNDCAELGRIAATKQLEAIQAAQLVPKIADMLAEANGLTKSAKADYDIADTAAHFAAEAKNPAERAEQEAIHDKWQARAEADTQKAADLRDK